MSRIVSAYLFPVGALLIAFALLVTASAIAQEPGETVEDAAAEAVTDAEAVVEDALEDATNEVQATDTEADAAEPAAPKPSETTESTPPETDGTTDEPADESAEDEVDDEISDETEPIEETETDETTPPTAQELLERFPEFGAVMHSAAVHLPIGLWLFGAMFVVIGVVVPSLRNQIPVACLIGGALFSIFAVLTGWWVAEFEYASDWQEIDWEDHIVKHRWAAIGAMVSSIILSIMAIASQRSHSRFWGFVWRVGFIALAVFVAWIGHLGGEIMKGEGFFEDALELWLNGS